MEINFNNLRLQIAYSLDNVIQTLNNGKMPETKYVLLDDDTWRSGNILLHYDNLVDDINDLKRQIIALICCYEKGNDEYIDLSDELEQNGGISDF